MVRNLQTQLVRCLLFCTAVLLGPGFLTGAKGQNPTPGNLIVLQAASSSANNTTASFVEVSPSLTSQTTSVQSISISGTGANAIRINGSATSTGYLSRTNDGSLLTFTGANNTDVSANVNTLNPRAVVTLNASRAVTIATTYTGASGNQTRSATSLNNTNWFIADQGGLYTNGSTSASPTGNFRGIKAFGGTVYVSQTSSTATLIQVSTVSAPSGGTITGLPGLTNNATIQDFYLIQSGSNGNTYDVLYIVSSASIAKYSLVNNSWTANGTTPTGGFGLAAQRSGSGANLYITTGGGATSANGVIKLIDNAGYNATINITSNTTLFTTGAGTTLKGIDFAPVAPVTAQPDLTLALSAPASATLNQPYNYSLVVSNPGSASASGIAVNFSLPASTSVTYNSAVGASSFTLNTPQSGTLVSFSSGTLAAGGSTTLTVNVTPIATGNVVSGTALVDPANAIAESNETNNSAPGVTVTVGAGSPPTISLAPTTTVYLSASAVSGVISDPTDPATTLGIDFTIADADTPVANLTVTASSSNQGVATDANLTLTGTGASRNLKITPTGVGYSTVLVSVSDGSNVTSYTVSYAASAASTTASRFHTGRSDASTAQAVDANYMFVGDDESNVLRLYNRTQSGLPVYTFDAGPLLNLTQMSGGVPREVDIEASAKLGNRIYWFGSQSNSEAGNSRTNRDRVFTTDISGTGAAATLSYVGRYDFLREDIIAWDVNNIHGKGVNYYGLAVSAADGKNSKLTDGYNIEGTELAPDGTTMYIGFRAPQVPLPGRTKALVIPVTNLTTLAASGGAQGSAQFGAPIELDLGGRGIREIKKNAANQYLIVAGPAGGNGAAPNNFRLYTWTGNPTDAPQLRAADLTPLSGAAEGSSIESIVELPATLDASSSIQFVMDNGDMVYYNDGTIAKDLTQNNFKKSRSDYATVGASLAPILVANPTTLSNFTALTGAASTPQVYTLTGTNLTADASVSVTAGF